LEFGSRWATSSNAGEITPVITRGGINGAIWSPSVSWNAYLHKYIMLHTNYDDEGAIYIRTSDDLFEWSPPALLMPPSTHMGTVIRH
jgi:hypothetical protein